MIAQTTNGQKNALLSDSHLIDFPSNSRAARNCRAGSKGKLAVGLCAGDSNSICTHRTQKLQRLVISGPLVGCRTKTTRVLRKPTHALLGKPRKVSARKNSPLTKQRVSCNR